MDVEALAIAARTDPHAAHRLYVLVRRDLERYVRRCCRVVTAADADDVVQNALVVVHRKLDQFVSRGPGSFIAWARAIAWIEAKQLLRVRARLAARHAAAAEKTVLTPATNLSSRIHRRQQVAILRQTTSALSPTFRRAIEVELAGGDGKRFAELFSLSPTAAKSVRWRARKRLEQLVSERLQGRGRSRLTGELRRGQAERPSETSTRSSSE